MKLILEKILRTPCFPLILMFFRRDWRSSPELGLTTQVLEGMETLTQLNLQMRYFNQIFSRIVFLSKMIALTGSIIGEFLERGFFGAEF
jgi:hypothetical protein